MKKNIAILYGGNSSESVISEKSANEIYFNLKDLPYSIYKIKVNANNWVYYDEQMNEYKLNLNDFSFLDENKERVYIDFAFISIHGDPGENGKLQAYLDMQGIPYNTPDVFSSALTFNKYACKLFLKNFDVLTPESILYKKGDPINENSITDCAGLPCFIKPNSGGSSFGTTKITNKEEIAPALAEALKEDSEVIIESYVKGTELSCGLLKTPEKEIIFPLTEIVPKNDFFDYEAKYTPGMADEIVPARVTEDITKKCMEISSLIYDRLNCRGLVRIDYIMKGNQIYFLEVNTVPGMSRESIVPKMIRAAGFKVSEILEYIIAQGLA